MKKKHLQSLKRNPRLALVGLLSMECFRWLPDEVFLKIVYRCRTGRKLNLKNPTRFNEKLQWLKLHDRQERYVIYVDKYAVREHVAKLIGEEYLIPLIGVWECADEINFDSLPERCVLKCTHDSGGIVFYQRGKTDIEKARHSLAKMLKADFYLRGREWPYKDVKRRIIAEQFMSEGNGKESLTDYKFFCFGGTPEVATICTDRDELGVKVTTFDMNWERVPFERNHYRSDPRPIPKPEHFEKMKELAAILAEDMPFVRVDLYEIQGKIYFGELTLYPGCGFGEFEPDEWDEKLGRLIRLPMNEKA